MQPRGALRLMLITSGKFNIPGEMVVEGTDQDGKPITLRIPNLDTAAVDAELDRLMSQPDDG